MEQKEQCFIITPIGDDTDPIRRHIDGIIEAAITPALGDEYEIIVAHKMGDLGSITKQVIDKVYHSKLVIANLTNRNPNVMYELALRHATGKPAIMIAERGTPLPSDIIMQRTIFYYNDAQGVLELRDELKKAVSSIDFEGKSGPVMEVLGNVCYTKDIQDEATELGRQDNFFSMLQELVQNIDRNMEQRHHEFEQLIANFASQKKSCSPATLIDPILCDTSAESTPDQTIIVAAKMLEDIKSAVSVYRYTVECLKAELEAELDALIGKDFVGAAANGIKTFYAVNIEPATGAGVTNLLNAIEAIADGIMAAIPGENGIDAQLAEASCGCYQ